MTDLSKKTGICHFFRRFVMETWSIVWIFLFDFDIFKISRTIVCFTNVLYLYTTQYTQYLNVYWKVLSEAGISNKYLFDLLFGIVCV